MAEFNVAGGGKFPRPFDSAAGPLAKKVSFGEEVLLASVELPRSVPLTVEVAPLYGAGSPPDPINQLPDVVQIRLVIGKNKDIFADAFYRCPANGFQMTLSAKNVSIWAKHDRRPFVDTIDDYTFTLTSGISPGVVLRDAQTDSWLNGAEVGNLQLPMPAYARRVLIKPGVDGTSVYQWLNYRQLTAGMPGPFLVPLAGETIPVPARAAGLQVTTTVTEPHSSLVWGFR